MRRGNRLRGGSLVTRASGRVGRGGKRLTRDMIQGSTAEFRHQFDLRWRKCARVDGGRATSAPNSPSMREVKQLMLPFSTTEFTVMVNRNSAAIRRFPTHARLIGTIAAEWNSIEQQVVLLFVSALGARSDVIFGMMGRVRGNRDKLDALNAGLHLLLRSRTRRSELKRLYNRLRKLLTSRNNYVHSLYGYSATD